MKDLPRSVIPSLQRTLRITTFVAPIACIAAAIGLWAGLAESTRYREQADAAARFLAWYMAPILLAVLVWLQLRLAVLDQLPRWVRIADTVVLTLATLRFVLGAMIPFSGHMLFLSYSALTMHNSVTYRWLAAVLIVETTVFKLWIWRDWPSWLWGLVLGVLAAMLVQFASRRRMTA